MLIILVVGKGSSFGVGCWREFLIYKEDDANIGCHMDEVSSKTLVKSSHSFKPTDGFAVGSLVQVNHFHGFVSYLWEMCMHSYDCVANAEQV